LRPQVLQLQDLRFPLQLGPKQHWDANVCEDINVIELKKTQREKKRGRGKGQTPPKEKVEEMNMQ